MRQDKMNLLTLISYKFIPAKLGGHLAHVYFHNFISEHAQAHIAGTKRNEIEKESIPIRFKLHTIFGKITPYVPGSYFFSLKKLVHSEQIDVIMCSHPYLGITAYLLCAITGVPLVSYSHNIESIRFKSIGKWWWYVLFLYEKWVMLRSEIVFFVAEEDRIWAIENYDLDPKKCVFSPFGINRSSIPNKDPQRKREFKEKYGIRADEQILYFVGSYNYFPNDRAVIDIVDHILPRLSARAKNFTILIVGKGLSKEIVAKIHGAGPAIKYIGFLEDIRDILDAADIMLNPLLSGGGIKTKAVEALGNNIKVVSTQNGAGGLDTAVCGNMLYISKDHDWDQYVSHIVEAMSDVSEIPDAFYEFYYWGNVTKRAANKMREITL
jgi:hypothetical protein